MLSALPFHRPDFASIYHLKEYSRATSGFILCKLLKCSSYLSRRIVIMLSQKLHDLRSVCFVSMCRVKSERRVKDWSQGVQTKPDLRVRCCALCRVERLVTRVHGPLGTAVAVLRALVALANLVEVWYAKLRFDGPYATSAPHCCCWLRDGCNWLNIQVHLSVGSDSIYSLSRITVILSCCSLLFSPPGLYFHVAPKNRRGPDLGPFDFLRAFFTISTASSLYTILL